MTAIRKIAAIPYRFPLTSALAWGAHSAMSAAEHVLVRVTTDDGVIGVADAPPRPFTYGETQAGIVAVIDGIFAPQLVGLDADRRAVAHARMHRTVGNPAAKAAVDMAVWDVLAQAWGTTVNRALGGFTDRMRVCHMLGFDAPAACVACVVAERVVDRLEMVQVEQRDAEAAAGALRALAFVLDALLHGLGLLHQAGHATFHHVCYLEL